MLVVQVDSWTRLKRAIVFVAACLLVTGCSTHCDLFGHYDYRWETSTKSERRYYRDEAECRKIAEENHGSDYAYETCMKDRGYRLIEKKC